MPAVNLRRRASPYGRSYQQVNGFYVHSSPPKGHYRLVAGGDGMYVHTCPPRVVHMNPSVIRQWLRGGEIDQLEQVVLEGQGHKLIGEYSPDPKVRSFLKAIPNYMARIADLHEAVNSGNLNKLKSLMPKDDAVMKNAALCKDLSGVGLLHKAVFRDRGDIARWLLENYPETARLKDRDGKTPLHYCGAATDKEDLWHAVVKAGADPNVVDTKGRTAAFYIERPGAIALPEARPPSGSMKRFTSGRDGIVVKPANIRIWIHDRDLGRLQQVLWEGYGNKLRMETSNNPRVKRFLDGIPYAMNAIKDLHAAVVNDDYDEFAKRATEPVPVQILASKDANGLNPLHKAAGLGRGNMVEDMIERNPKLVYTTDHDGRTPLHYAAWLRNNEHVYNLLLENGADEMAFDNHGRLPAYYRANQKEPLSKLLSVIPDAPRTSVTFPPSWDWTLLQSSSRSTVNIPALVTTSDRKSLSDHNINGLQPPEMDLLKPEGIDPSRVTRTIEEVREKIVKVEQKMFESEGEKQEVEAAPEEVAAEAPQEEEKAEETEERAEKVEDNEEDAAEKEEAEVVQEPDVVQQQEEESEVVQQPEEEAEAVQQPEEEPEAVQEPKEEAEVVQQPEEFIPEQPINLWTKEEEEPEEVAAPPEGHSTPVEEPVEEEKAPEEPYDEKREREIAEERQRLMDEGLIKVADDDEEELEDEDREVEEIIRNGDMQALATMVLEGEGERLLGKTSINAEIQGFLDNVPSYIAKIKAVHAAAKAGELRDLQAALDRRRFAVAKDGSNPVGVTPLHVAVLYGRTPIIKYLGGRFPETLNVKDKKGRTPLHYAASLADNSHYFNILLNLGADRRVKDDADHVASHYLENPGVLTQEMLLEEFNAPVSIAEDMLSDKGVSSPVTDPSLHEREPEAVANEGQAGSKPEEEDVGEDAEESPSAFNPAERDEYGQTVVHFGAARAHGRGGLFQLIQESGINIAYRDELYRTARDVALQANIPENITEIDKFVLGIAARGETEKLMELLLEGYDHILDLEDDEDCSIVDVVTKKERASTLEFLNALPSFEERRERIHRAIRAGEVSVVEDLVSDPETGKRLLIGKSTTSRCSLHIAVLCQQEEVTELIAQKCPETLRIGDNLERTALHYAMGVDKVESISKILIRCGAKRLAKDLKGRQPTYYFMNKSDILRLQEEEELLRM